MNHDVLMARVARRVKDKRVLRLIRRYLQAGVLEGRAGVASPRRDAARRPALAAVEQHPARRAGPGAYGRRGHRFVRYADDCNVYVRSKAAGERVMASLERFLEKRLRLQVNRSKSAVERPWKRRFLGYTVTNQRRRASAGVAGVGETAQGETAAAPAPRSRREPRSHL